MIIFLFLLIFFSFKKKFKFKLKKRLFRNEETLSFNRSNFSKWMNLSKKERYYQSKIESASYLKKRKDLLEEIRKEYKKISKGDIKKT